MSTKFTYTSYASSKWGIVRSDTDAPEYIETSRNNNKLVALVGLLIIIAVLIFAYRWFSSAVLFAAIIPGNPFDEGQRDDDLKNLILGILGVILLVVGLPWALFNA